MTYSVNESHIGQQLLRAICIAANDIRSSAGVESIPKFHDRLNDRFTVGEEAEAVIYELKARMTLCHMCQKKRPTSSSWRDRL